MLDQLFVVVSLTALAMVAPGPDMLLVVRNTLVEGRRAGLRTSLGILCGNAVHITYCLLGIGVLISRSILAFSTLKYVAAAYLIYLGVSTARVGSHRLDTPRIVAAHVATPSFVQGFLNNLLNPKGTLFYLGVFTGVITPETSPNTMGVLVGAMLLVSATFWVCFVYALDRPALRHRIDRSQRAMNRACGALMIALGLRVAAMSR